MSEVDEIRQEILSLHSLADDIINQSAEEAAKIVARGRVEAIQEGIAVFYKENKVKFFLLIALVCAVISLAVSLPLTSYLVSQEAKTAKNNSAAVAQTARDNSAAVAKAAKDAREALCTKFKASVNIQIATNKKQQAQSDAIFSNLEKQGVGAFGLSPNQLKKVLAQGKALQKKQLDQLYSIASSNCS